MILSNKINLKEKFKYLFQEDTRYYIVTGGRGGAKSFSVGTFLCLLSYENDQKILFTRKTMTSAHISVIPEFNEKIELLARETDFKVNKTEIINNQSGSDIMFRGLQSSSGDNTANLKSIQGVSCWVLDEAEELTDETMFDKVDLSIRSKKKHNRVILILNPASKEHFIFKRFFEGMGVEPGFNGIKGNVTYIHTTYLDNLKHLSQSFLDQVEAIKEKNPIKYNHVILGGWLDKAEGVVFTNWKLGKFEENGKVIYGQDYGFSIDPTTLVKVSIEKSLKKIYIKELLYKTKMTTSEIAVVNERYCGKELIIADSAEPRLIDELKAKGNNIKGAVKGQGSVSAGIAIMQDYELIIDPDSINLIKELNNYVWSDKKSNTPIDAYNHLIDPIRYAITHEITNRNDYFFF